MAFSKTHKNRRQVSLDVTRKKNRKTHEENGGGEGDRKFGNGIVNNGGKQKQR